MITNYLKIAWRNLVRNKTFSILNISGLALGMACSLLILLWVLDERSIDKFHKNGSQLFQVYERTFANGQADYSSATPGLLAQELKKTFPDIQFASGFEYASAPGTQNTLEAGDKINKFNGSFASSDFLQMFSYTLLQGNAAQSLSSPKQIAISRKMAEYYFGNVATAIGKVLRFENKENLQVSAVFENIGKQSSIRFDFLRSWSDFVSQNQWVNNWGNTSPSTYIQIKSNTNASIVESKIRDFIHRYQQKTDGFRIELGMQPYTEKYLYSHFKNGYPDGGRISYVQIFTLIAIFILLIACINFMNLATAQSAKRAKEVGLRKVIGAMRSSLFLQFIGEALLLSTVSVIISLFVCWMLLPAFNSLTGKLLTVPVSQPLFWSFIIALIIIVSLVAGSYPALFLSSLKPVKTLKGIFRFSGTATLLRKGLVVFQFSLSIILITGVIVIYKQINYIQQKNIGYNRENLIYIPIEGELIKKYDLFKQQAARMPGVLTISKMRNSPTKIEHHTGSISWPGKDPNQAISFADAVVGYDFVKTMNASMAAGRDFSKEYGSDSTAYLLNETAVTRMGFKDAIGQTVSWGNRPGTIIGVLKDFHFSSLHQPIEPLIVRLDENWKWGTILIRTKAGASQEVITGLAALAKEMNPKIPFTYQFSDLEFDKLYRSEQVVGSLSNYFALLAIVISCLGLFGLATFTAHQRTKEIGVRKVLGASVPNVVRLLSFDFLKPIALAIIIAMPLSAMLVNNWLQNFAYKVDVELWVFGLAGFITVCIALLTVSYQSIRAAFSNPIKSLRSE